MPTLAEVRSKYPQYDDMSDTDLAGALYSKFYSDMPREEFDAKIGMKAAAPTAQTDPAPSAEGRGTMLPFDIGPDQGATGAVREITKAAQSNPLSSLNPIPALVGGYFKGRGIESAVPEIVKEPIEANVRGLTNQYPIGEEGERQRAQDALAVGTAALTGNVAGRAAGAIPKRPIATAPAEEAWRPAVRETPRKTVEPAGPTPQQEALEAAARRGVEIPRGASDNFAVRATAGALKEIPLVGSPLVKAGREAYGKIERGVGGVSDELGGGSVEQAGGALRDDINDWVKTVSKAEGDEIYASVRKMVKNERAPLQRTGVLIRNLDKEAAESFIDPPAVLNKVRDAANAAEGLTYSGMSRLRSEIGQMLSGEITPEGGMSKPALKRLYGSLSEDMAFLAKTAAGKKGEAAWQTANTTFRDTIAARRTALLKIVGKKGDATPADVVATLVSMAGSKRGADISRLMLAKKTAGKEAWDALGATVIDNMGASKDGWSLAKFRTDYSKLNENAKGVLFNQEHKAALDDYFKIGGPFEALERLGNPSGSGRTGSIVGGIVGGVVNFPVLLKSAAGSYIMARILARPMGVKSLSRYVRAAEQHTKAPTPATAQVLAQTERGLQKALEELGIDPDALIPAGAAERQQEAP